MKKLLLISCFASLLLGAMNSCESLEDSNQGTAATKTLNATESLRVKRFLHPMPQELRLSDFAYEVKADDCAIESSPEASAMEKNMLDDFKKRWKTKRGVELKDKDAKLNIVAGVVKNSPILQKAAEKGLFDAKYLSERKNPEQAYVLKSVAEGERITVYVAANDNQGLYYGLLTLEQLLNGLSKDENLIMPHCAIVDWPDVRGRGSWVALGGVNRKPDQHLKACEKRIERFARLKLNLIDAFCLYPNKLDKNGDLEVTWTRPKETIRFAENHAVTLIPGTSHLPHHPHRQPLVKKRYPDTQGVNSAGEKKGLIMCISNPNTRKYLTDYLVAIAKQYDIAGIFMSEVEGPTGVCHCPKCKGNLRECFIKETKLIMDAYREAKKVNPKFRIILALTQGSYPHHYEMLKHIPKEVVLNFYSGIMTYRATFQKYNTPPSIQEIQRLGYTIGSVPSPVPWNTNLFGPFQTPQYVRLLCGEAEDRGLDFMDAFLWPNPFFYDLNGEAMAEFLWNSKGRTAKEFTVAWATRKGLQDPDETAAIIEMMEYPERGFYNCKFWQLIPKIVSFVTGKERPSRGMLRGFEFSTHEEMIRSLAICDDAVARSEKLKNPELLAASKLMRCAMTIMERYGYCLQNAKNETGKEQAIETLKRQLELFPKLFESWFKLKNPSKYTRRCVNGLFHKKWKKILKELKDAKISAESKKLLGEMKSGKLKVYKLGSEWKFKPGGNDVGLNGKWYAADFDDSKWSPIKAGLGYGWEKQGHDSLTGHAWYRSKIKIPPKMRYKKHLYFFFEGVDEDAEVFVNGKKMFTNDYKAVNGIPGCTWDKPFSFDAKPPVLKRKGENIIAVRVLNRMGMGGIWKPVYLIANDSPAKTKDLAPVVMQFENESFNPLYD